MNNETMFDLEHLQRFLDNPEQFKIKHTNTTMYNDKLQNKQQLTAAVKGGQYLVGSFSEAQGISFSNFPAIHYSSQAARAECKRLATQNPNKTYVFVKLMGGEETITQPQYISI
jgi:hypothetical protein